MAHRKWVSVWSQGGQDNVSGLSKLPDYPPLPSRNEILKQLGRIQALGMNHHAQW